MSQSFKLYRLQQIDTQLDKNIARVKEIDAIMSDNKVLRQAQLGADRASEALEETRKHVRRTENDVQAQLLKIEQTEATLYSGKVSNPKELQDLENEAAALKRYLGVLEERQLEAMLREEEKDSINQSSLSNLEKIKSRLSVEHGNLTEEKAALQKDIIRLEGERYAAINMIPAEDLKQYQWLREQRRGIAVAKVTDNFCSACGSILSTSLLYAARSPNNINCCDTCGRILYAG